MSLIYKIKNEHLNIGISTFGAELQYITAKDGTEFLWNGDENVWSGKSPILFPICSGLKNDKYCYNGKEYTLKKHGFAKLSEFTCHKIDDTSLKFTLESSEETKNVYPFDFELDVIYAISENTLNVTYIVKNLSNDEMYFSIGAHEAYACPEGIEDYYIEFDTEQTLDSFITQNGTLTSNYTRIAENAKMLPLKQEYFDNKSLIFKNIKFDKATLVHKNSSKKVIVEFKDFRYFLLWTLPDAKFICLEPWNGITDLENSSYDITEKEGIIKLCENETFQMVHSMTFNN